MRGAPSRSSAAVLLTACATAPHVSAVGQSLAELLSPFPGGAEQARLVAGTVVLVELWASWAQPCARTLPIDDALREALAPQGFAVVTINVDADRRAADAFLRDLDLTAKLPVLFDPEARQTERHPDIRRLPTRYLVDRHGRGRHEESGASSESRTRDILLDLLHEPSA